MYFVLVVYGPGYYVQTRDGLNTHFSTGDGGLVHTDIAHPSMAVEPVWKLCLAQICMTSMA